MKARDKETAWLLNEKYNGSESREYFVDLERLESGEPLAYVIGHVPFLNTTIYLDSHPLIPRTETEYWVEEAIRAFRGQTPKSKPLRVLDLCAGSGCVGVAVLASLPNIAVDFAEIDESHHATILKNLEQNGISRKRVHIVGGDLFENITDTYDYILANPPYINRDAGTIEENVAAYEPERALYGGKDGTEMISRILHETPTHLSTGGALYLEHEPEQTLAIEDLAEKLHLSAEPHKDQYGLLRYTILTRL
jgi:HemK-like putative methylase